MRDGSGIWSPDQPRRVAPRRAVVPLVVVPDARHHVGEEGDGLEDSRADLGVPLDLLVLLGREPVGLRDDAVRDPDLADVVQQARDVDALDHLARQPELAPELRGVDADALRVAARVGVLRVHRLGERADRLHVADPQLLVLVRELLGAIANLRLERAVHVLELEVLLARHLVQAADLALQVVVVEGLPQRGLQLLVVPRLGDQAVDLAVVDRLDRDVHLRVAGEHHAHGVRMALADHRQQLDAVHLRHPLVRDHDLGRLVREQAERLAAARGRQHPARLVPEQALHGAQDVHLVVHEEHGVLAHRGEPPRPFDRKGRAVRRGAQEALKLRGVPPIVAGDGPAPANPALGTGTGRRTASPRQAAGRVRGGCRSARRQLGAERPARTRLPRWEAPRTALGPASTPAGSPGRETSPKRDGAVATFSGTRPLPVRDADLRLVSCDREPPAERRAGHDRRAAGLPRHLPELPPGAAAALAARSAPAALAARGRFRRPSRAGA